MYEYRVTKYDPALRDEKGHFRGEEWCLFSDVGKVFGGCLLSLDEYERVERAYVEVATAFLSESAVRRVYIRDVENSNEYPVIIQEGESVGLKKLGPLFQRVLRDQIWARFESEDCFVHFGWDYYMYVGVPKPCPTAEILAAGSGLHVEDFCSPYKGGE